MVILATVQYNITARMLTLIQKTERKFVTIKALMLHFNNHNYVSPVPPGSCPPAKINPLFNSIIESFQE